MIKKEIIKKAKKIKLLITDVDGVLTDGNMYLTGNANEEILEIKGFHAHDGIGLRLLRQNGVQTGIITGRVSHGAKSRAKSLSMKYYYQGFLEKLKPFDEIVKHSELKYSEVAFAGDDLTDLPLLKKCGLAFATQNAVDDVKKAAHFVTSRKGGEGAMREICEIILKAKGMWPKIIKNCCKADWGTIAKEKIRIITAK